MSLPTNFFIGRGGAATSLYTFTLIGAGGGAGGSAEQYSSNGGAGGAGTFTLEMPKGVTVSYKVGEGGNVGDAKSNNYMPFPNGGPQPNGSAQAATGGGRTEITISGISLYAVVGGGGGSGYSDMGGFGGGFNKIGSFGVNHHYTGGIGNIMHDNFGSGEGGTLTRGGYGGGHYGNDAANYGGNAGSYNQGAESQTQSLSYPGGAGGDGYYGGGSGSNNAGGGGGPGGGGSGYLSSPLYAATIINTSDPMPVILPNYNPNNGATSTSFGGNGNGNYPPMQSSGGYTGWNGSAGKSGSITFGRGGFDGQIVIYRDGVQIFNQASSSSGSITI